MKKVFGIGIVLLLLVFIWGNSALPAVKSNVLSDAVINVMQEEVSEKLPQVQAAKDWITIKHIRKSAHMIEFGCLGAGMTMILLYSGKRKVISTVPTILLIGVLTGLTDETIQLFNDRTSSVKDVWIDSAGYLIGCIAAGLVLSIVYLCRRGIKARRQKKTGSPERQSR